MQQQQQQQKIKFKNIKTSRWNDINKKNEKKKIVVFVVRKS